MNSSFASSVRAILAAAFALLCSGLIGGLAAAHDGVGNRDSNATTGASQGAQQIQNKATEAYRLELLEIAYRSAAKFPLEPHIKNRGRAQEIVFQAALEMDQPVLARQYADGIADWVRASCYADYAAYCINQGDTTNVEIYLNLAARLAQAEEDWRRDQIRSKIAVAYLLLNQPQRAAKFQSGLADSERGRVECTLASIVPAEGIDQRLQELQALAATDNFDQKKGALQAMAILYRRVIGEPERRKSIESAIKSAWTGMPFPIRIDLLAAMAQAAIGGGDATLARIHVDEATGFMSAMEWEPEDRIALIARLAGLRARAGEADAAREQTLAALALFSSERDRIADIYRGRALRPIAEAFIALNDTKNANTAYGMAIEEGAINPNARPRTDDLVATCCSMALNNFQPDEAMWKRLNQIREGLRDPW